MILVIGKNGFVGSALCKYFEKKNIEYRGVGRQDFNDFVGQQANYVINANGSGLKWKANENPRFDFDANVKSTLDYIFGFKYNVFIHISSIDVYADASSLKKTREDNPIDPTRLPPYGFHKFLSELMVKQYCPHWLILRLGGLVGPQLKKNPAYDWSHGKPFLISRKSRLTFVHTETVAEIISELISRKVTNEIINVCSLDSIMLGDLDLIRDFKSKEQDTRNLAIQNYCINVDKLKAYFKPKTSRAYIEKYLKEDLEIDRIVCGGLDARK